MSDQIIGHIIYCHTSPSGKCYVGQTRIKENQTPEKAMNARWRGHIRQSQSNYLCIFHNAITKYGSENFQHEILEVINVENWDFANERESYWINEKNCLAPIGYNSTSGGLNGKRCEKTRKKLSEALKGRKLSEETRKKLSEAGKGKKHKPMSEKTKKKLSEVKNGKKHSEEAKQKISESQKGKKHKKHKPFSEEHKKKLSEARQRYELHKQEIKELDDILMSFYEPGTLWNN